MRVKKSQNYNAIKTKVCSLGNMQKTKSRLKCEMSLCNVYAHLLFMNIFLFHSPNWYATIRIDGYFQPLVNWQLGIINLRLYMTINEVMSQGGEGWGTCTYVVILTECRITFNMFCWHFTVTYRVILTEYRITFSIFVDTSQLHTESWLITELPSRDCFVDTSQLHT